MWTGKRIVTRTSYPSIAPEWLCQSTLASQAQTTSMPISSKGPRARTPTLHARDHYPTPVSIHILNLSYKYWQSRDLPGKCQGFSMSVAFAFSNNISTWRHWIKTEPCHIHLQVPPLSTKVLFVRFDPPDQKLPADNHKRKYSLIS